MQKHVYVADFYCHNLGLVLELDGKIHDFQKDRDKFRDHIINILEFTVLRFSNMDVLNNTAYVLEKILSVV